MCSKCEFSRISFSCRRYSGATRDASVIDSGWTEHKTSITPSGLGKNEITADPRTTRSTSRRCSDTIFPEEKWGRWFVQGNHWGIDWCLAVLDVYVMFVHRMKVESNTVSSVHA